MPIALPKKKEQEKIAEVLTGIDKLIRNEITKLEYLRKQKKGLLQKLFPSDEKSFPEFRFKEFKSKDMKFQTGDKLFEPVSNRNHKCDLPVLAISQEHGAIPRDKIDYNVFVSEKSLESYKVVEIGDFIISLRSFQGGIEYSAYHGICSPAYIILRRKTDICDQYFRYYFKHLCNESFGTFVNVLVGFYYNVSCVFIKGMSLFIEHFYPFKAALGQRSSVGGEFFKFPFQVNHNAVLPHH